MRQKGGNTVGELRMGRIGQIKIYVGKCARTFVNEKGWKSLICTLIISIILAWIVGDKTFSIYESTRSGVFAMICGCIWTGLFNSIQSVCRERAIIKREHRTGLHISSYVIAHMIFELAQCIAEGLIMTVIFDCFREFPSHAVIFNWTGLEFFIGFTLVIFCADTLGIMVSCIVKNENAAMTVMPFVLIIQLVMSGMMFELPENAEFIKQLTVSKWGLTSICSSADINELPTKETLQKFYAAKEAGGQGEDWKDMGITQAYEEEYEATSQHVAGSWLVLSGYSLLYGFVGVLLLKRVDKDKR